MAFKEKNRISYNNSELYEVCEAIWVSDQQEQTACTVSYDVSI